MKLTKWTILRAIALILTVTLVWCWNWDRLELKHWQVPVDYYEDCPMVMGWIQAAKEGDFVPFLRKDVERLGAPYVANWNDWPVADEGMIFSVGMLARWVGLFQACNLAVLLAFISNALAFYAVCRLCRFRWEWAFVGAVLFAFAYLHATRLLHHVTHTYSYTIPFAIFVAWLVGFSRRVELWDKRFWICMVTSALMSVSNPYHLNMFAQMICLSLLVQLITQRRKVNLQIGFVSLALVAIGFFLINLDTFSYGWQHGKNYPALGRSYYETELFALKPIELVTPPTSHKIAAMANLGGTYMRDAWLRGEVFSPYLGIVCIAGFVWMFAEALFWLARRSRTPGRLPAYAPQVFWVFVYSVVGGLNCFIALQGIPLFRGSNRYSIFISALVLLFMVSRLTVLSRRWSQGWRLVVAAGILVVGLVDQLPQQMAREETLSIAKNIEVDKAFASAMEAKLPPKAMVFQLPVMPYPESVAVQNLQAYELMRPWFFSKTLHFSFGANKGRARDDWQKEVEKLSGGEMAATLERYGFGAIYLNRKGFADRADGLIKQLVAAGKTDIFEDDLHEQVCVILKPSASPVLPSPVPQLAENYLRGWAAVVPGPNGRQSWANDTAAISFDSAYPAGQPVTVQCQVAGLMANRLVIELNGKEIWSGTLAVNQLIPVRVTGYAKEGSNVVRFKLLGEVARATKSNPVPRSFVVMGLQITAAK
ncbi:MAG: hypothetical protein QM813_15845 [Verrucomicrobiota bacterium]